jgi:gluconolactonase
MRRAGTPAALRSWLLASFAAALAAGVGPVPAGEEVPDGLADAVVDLATAEGAALVGGRWRYSDARIVEVDFRGPGPDLKPSGPPNRTYDIAPRAGAADFDDSSWPILDPASLPARRSTGRVSFNWYRIGVTIPERVGSFPTAGTTAVFQVTVDDYAEVWVDGRLPRRLGQTGGSLIAGWNVPNRVLLAREATPGRRFQIAVFGINGPLSDPPANFIWVREAKVLFYRTPRSVAARPVAGEVLRLDPGLDAVVPAEARIEKVAEGFTFVEGPVWSPEGSLLFSSPNSNVIFRWAEPDGLSVFRPQSGYSGADIAEYTQPGSNGLAFDRKGRLTVCEHGNRRVTRLEKDGSVTVLADRFEGKRLNSPNDLVYRSDGALYFTDPPFGLPRFHDDPRRELDFSGVFALVDGALKVVSKDLSGPNGLAFSPDETYLYVDNWDPARKVVMRYEVRPDGSLANGRVFADMTGAPGEEALDGLKVDARGNLYVSGPGGVWILSPEGKHLGTIRAPELPANFAWGGPDGRTLYMTARSGLYRVRLGVAGSGSAGARAAAAPGGAAAAPASPVVERLDARLDALISRDARIDTVASGHEWVEGPAWDRRLGRLLFSDIPVNSVFAWKEGNGVSLFLTPSGYSGAAPFTGREPGSNGLAFDRRGRLVLCEHGDRRITRLEEDGTRTVLADRYQGKRLNSPNDVVVARSGDLYFTDPPFGLPGTFDDPAKELPFQGVYRLSEDGKIALLTKDHRAPNGIALAPDERTLYVSDAVPGKPAWWAYALRPDGTLGPGRMIFEASRWARERRGGADGIKVDRSGNLFTAGPGGIYVLAPDGAHLGTIVTGTATGNCGWGEDGSSLFVAADTSVHRIRTTTRGAGF